MTRRQVKTTVFRADDPKQGMNAETIRHCLSEVNPLSVPKFYVGFKAQVQKIEVVEEQG